MWEPADSPIIAAHLRKVMASVTISYTTSTTMEELLGAEEHDLVFDWLLDIYLEPGIHLRDEIRWEFTRAAELLNLSDDPKWVALQERQSPRGSDPETSP